MNVLVTGHAGYAGSVLTRFLASLGHRIAGFDVGWFAACVLASLDPAAVAAEAPLDLRDVEKRHLQGVDAVVHLAGLSNDPLGELDPELTVQINLEATRRLAVAAKAAGVGRFVFASSCSVYGAAIGGELLDEHAPLRPVTAYARTKIDAEKVLAELADDRFSPVSLRNSTLYGVSPRLRLDLVLNQLVASALTTGKVLLLSDGTPWRPLLHVEDLCRVVAACLEAPRERIHAEIFNVGRNAENYRVLELAEIVVDTVPGSRLEIAPGAGPDPRTYRVDFSKLARHLPDLELVWDARLGARELHRALVAEGLGADEMKGSRFVRLRRIQELVAAGRLGGDLRWLENQAVEAVEA